MGARDGLPEMTCNSQVLIFKFRKELNMLTESNIGLSVVALECG